MSDNTPVVIGAVALAAVGVAYVASRGGTKDLQPGGAQSPAPLPFAINSGGGGGLPTINVSLPAITMPAISVVTNLPQAAQAAVARVTEAVAGGGLVPPIPTLPGLPTPPDPNTGTGTTVVQQVRDAATSVVERVKTVGLGALAVADADEILGGATLTGVDRRAQEAADLAREVAADLAARLKSQRWADLAALADEDLAGYVPDVGGAAARAVEMAREAAEGARLTLDLDGWRERVQGGVNGVVEAAQEVQVGGLFGGLYRFGQEAGRIIGDAVRIASQEVSR